MKSFTRYIGLFALLFVLTSVSQASIAVGDRFKLNASLYPGTTAGEFGAFREIGAQGSGVFPTVAYGDEDFITFCAERYEYFSNNEILVVAGKTYATAETSLALTVEAAYLFREFASGGSFSGGTDPTTGYSGSSSDANTLQKAIWHYIGGQIGGQSSNKYVKWIEGLDLTGFDLDDLNVKVLNLVSTSGAKRQDQLYWFNPADTALGVPEPMSASLWICGLAGVMASRRRRKS